MQTTAVQPLSHAGEFSDLTELSHADLNGLVSDEIEGEDEIFKQFGNFELDNIFAEFEEKVRIRSWTGNNKQACSSFFQHTICEPHAILDAQINIAHCSLSTHAYFVFLFADQSSVQ